MAPEVAALLSRLLTFRQDADCTTEYLFTVAMAQEGVADARTFIAAARAILVADGWVTRPSSP